ncbi:MAG: hypothetical protein R3E79_20970 [Caldilineaceae bacterium]
MLQIKPAPKRLAPFLVYLILFHGVWIFWVYRIYPWLLTLGEATLTYALTNISLRLLIWVWPILRQFGGKTRLF